MAQKWLNHHATSTIDKTKHVIIDLLNQQVNNQELATELNQRQLYMSSGASWNAGRVTVFLSKHQIKSDHRQPLSA